MSEREVTATILCISSEVQGQRFLKEASEQGCHVLLLTLDSLEHADWPRDALADVITMPDGLSPSQICARVSYLSRHHHIDRIVALSTRDMETAALLREHIRLPGMGQSTTRLFRDRLAMRMRAQRAGVATPGFVAVLNYDDLRAFMEDVPQPWLLTPRMVSSTESSRPIDQPQKLWRMLDELGDAQSHYLLERALSGTRYHVESVSWGRESLLNRVLRCSSPQDGLSPGQALTTQVVPSDALDARYVLDLHEQALEALGMAAGITHSEFLRAEENGQYYFTEALAGAGPALSTEVVSAATGIDLWVEWASIEVAALFGEEYKLPRIHEERAVGSVLWAEGSSREIDAPEVFYRAEGNSGLVLRSESAGRIEQLLVELRDASK